MRIFVGSRSAPDSSFVVVVFQIDRYEMEYILKRSSSDVIAGKTDGDNSDAVIRLRGLPFGCTKEEIATFFLGMSLLYYASLD